VLVLCLILMAGTIVFAGESEEKASRALTADDYARAEKFMSYHTGSLVLNLGIRPVWLPGDRFWYRKSLKEGRKEFVLVDPARETRRPAFDHAGIAKALSSALEQPVEADDLPFTTFEYSKNGKEISFRVAGTNWISDLKGKNLRKIRGEDKAEAQPGPSFGLAAVSPDGRYIAFIQEDNLWLREEATGKVKQLTTDGEKDFGYATDNAGWTRSNRPVLLWSPDSTKIATFQQDQRGVGEMYLVETKVGHPTLQAWKYPLPGDEVITTIQRVIIHIDGPRVVRLKMPPDEHRSTFTDDIKTRGGILADAEWSPDGSELAFISSSRDHKQAVLRLGDPETGEIRDVLEETVDTYFESGDGRPNWRFLADSDEVIWFSERDNWGHLYLYDLRTGRLKNRITSGEGCVLEILEVDEKNRTITFFGGGMEKGRDPYFQHLYRVGFDGRGLTLLTPEDADHLITMSPSGRFFVDSFSKPDVPPVTVLRDREGKRIMVLEEADISALLASGWKPPIPFTVKGRDGVTDIYGLMFRPTNFDPAKKYPIVNSIYPGPQSGSVGSRRFSAARSDAQALAELGFVVVKIDGMGTPGRSKSFHDAYYGDMGDNTLPDQVTGMKQLAERYPWIDIEKAGIYGHSGGGFAACDAMFRYPDFFKVGVSQAGNHDNRGYEDDWAEKWQGLLVRNSDGTSNYDDQANQNIAKNLKGKLLLAHGTMDGNVPFYLTLLVVDELIKANKDFDLILFPNRGHGFGREPYMVRRRWDFFVRHLLGVEPPDEFKMTPPVRGAIR
jgi:dipeptidyl aminopeptidase/acylaminoacyl peptidase